jgi:nicotinamidase-related amidase
MPKRAARRRGSGTGAHAEGVSYGRDRQPAQRPSIDCCRHADSLRFWERGSPRGGRTFGGGHRPHAAGARSRRTRRPASKRRARWNRRRWELFLPPTEGDGQHVIRKDTDDGFHKTELSSLLNKRAIRHLAVCGVMSEMCVSATARSALNLGYHVVLPHDGHATYDIPAVEGLADAVPHTMASRVAEWALGDQIDIIAHAADVQFRPPSMRTNWRSPRPPWPNTVSASNWPTHPNGRRTERAR